MTWHEITPFEGARVLHGKCALDKRPVGKPGPGDASAAEESEAVSFVIRIWQYSTPAGPELRGWIEHVQTGRRTFFLRLEDMSSLIKACLHAPGQAERGPGLE